MYTWIHSTLTWCHRSPVQAPTAPWIFGTSCEQELDNIGPASDVGRQGVLVLEPSQDCSVPVCDWQNIVGKDKRSESLGTLSIKTGKCGNFCQTGGWRGGHSFEDQNVPKILKGKKNHEIFSWTRGFQMEERGSRRFGKNFHIFLFSNGEHPLRTPSVLLLLLSSVSSQGWQDSPQDGLARWQYLLNEFYSIF